MRGHTYLEFFAGGGMARAGLGDEWRCLFANDFDQKKVATYEANWGAGDIKQGDVASLDARGFACEVGRPRMGVVSLPGSVACRKLSGTWSRARQRPTRSGTFWPFWKLMRGLALKRPRPATIVLENVCRVSDLPRRQGFRRDRHGAVRRGLRVRRGCDQAAHFVPQSRPRVFFIAIREGEGDSELRWSRRGPQARLASSQP